MKTGQLMKITRLIVVAMLLALAGGVASAQQSQSDETLEFKPHWSLGLQGGVAHTVGETAYGKLISPSAALNAQWQFHHAMALRFGFGGWQGRGALVLPERAEYRFSFLQLSADFVLDLASLIGGYDHQRVCVPYVFAGVGGTYGFDNKAASAYEDNLLYYWESKFFVPGRLGLGVDFRLNENVTVGIEANGNMLSDKFNSKKAGNPDWQYNLLAGIKFNLGKSTRQSKAYADKVAAEEAAKVAMEEAERIAAEKAAADKAQADKEAADKAAAEKAAADKAAAEKAAAEKAGRLAEAKSKLQAAEAENVFFLLGSSVIRKEQAEKLVALSKILSEYPDLKVLFVGYADRSTGNPKLNLDLSKRRSEVVKARLVELGVDSSRVETDHKGCTVQPYKTPEENRVAICTLK